jgi:hypothetical protein
MRIIALILGALLPLGSVAMAEDLPVPPIPPQHPPLADAAPVPNVNAEAPIPPASGEPTVDVRLYRVKMFDPSLGFVPGSQYQSTEDRKPIQTPGLSINVPLK